MIQNKKPISLNVSKPLKPTVQLKEKRTHSLTCLLGQWSWCAVCQRAKGLERYHKSKQKESSVIQLDHSFYKVHGEVKNLRVHTLVEIVPSCQAQS